MVEKMNIIFLLISQSIGLLLGIMKSIFLPMYLTVSNFGYWQIYLLYVGYLGVLSFGFNDGLLARYGRYNFNELPSSKIGNSIKLFMLINLALTTILILSVNLVVESEKINVYIFIILNIPLATLNGIFLFLLQSTNQIKKYSIYSTIDKIILVIIIALIIFLDKNDIYTIMIVDTLSKLVQSILMYLSFKELFKEKFRYKELLSISKEIYSNIKRGILILLSNLIGMLLFGYSMFLIERSMPIEKYSMYSFSISTTNIILLFISAISIIVFPYISRVKKELIQKEITILNYFISLLSIVMITFYFPIVWVINIFLIQYKEVLIFLPYIFISVILQLKYNAIFLPFSKLQNEENKILYINIKMLIFILITTSFSILVVESLIITSMFLFIALFVRNIIIEKTILSEITYKKRNTFIDLIIYISFFTCIFYFNTFTVLIVFIIFLCVVLLLNYKIIINIFLERRKT